MFSNSAIFGLYNKEARGISKALKSKGVNGAKITKSNLPLYKFLLEKKGSEDVLIKNSKEIVEGIEKRPDTSYAVSGVLDRGLGHVFTIRTQEKIDPMKAIREIFSIYDKKPERLELVEKIIDKNLSTIPFKELIANGVLPAIADAKSSLNIELLDKFLPKLSNDSPSLTSSALKKYLERDLTLLDPTEIAAHKKRHGFSL